MEALLDYIFSNYEGFSRITSENLSFLYILLQVFATSVIFISGIPSALLKKDLEKEKEYTFFSNIPKILNIFALIISCYMLFILCMICLSYFYDRYYFISKMIIFIITNFVFLFFLHLGLSFPRNWKAASYAERNRFVGD